MRFEQIPLRREVDAVDLSDLTDAERSGPAYWDPEADVATLVVPVDPSATAAEAKAIRRRLVTKDAADERQLLDLIAAHKDPATPSWARPLITSAISAYGDLADLV